MARYFRNLGGTHRRTSGEVIETGAVCRLVPGPRTDSNEEVTYREVDREPLRWQEMKGYKPEPPAVRGDAMASGTTVEPVSEPAADGEPVPPEVDPKVEPEKPSEPPAEGELDPSPFHKGGGYYEIPGTGTVKGRAAAIEAMKAGVPPVVPQATAEVPVSEDVAQG